MPNEYVRNLGQKFKQIAAEFAPKTALHTEAGPVTYAELDRLSDSVATTLMRFGVNLGDVVCIRGDKQLVNIASIIGALKCGATYSVFDPESPLERLHKIFERCAPQVVLTETDESLSGIRELGFNVLNLRELVSSSAIDHQSISERLQNLTAGSPAYIMFTSGSTGFPKGAVMTHQNVLNLISWSREEYQFTPDDVLTSVNPLYFDNSVFDLYSSLFSGASLAVFDAATVRNPAKLLQLLDDFKCTSWFSVPSMLMYLQTVRALRQTSMKFMRRIIFGGEGYPKGRLKELYDLFSSRIAFYNVYGPTECTCICSSYTVSDGDFAELKGFLPLGSRMIANFEYLIVDEELNPLPPGQIGELVLRGPNVGLGYFRDPERTQAAFIQNPQHDNYREPTYRTGDLVFLNPGDGKIHITGRADNQIKHMGYRIELEEIENALSCISSVAQSAVIHCEIKGLSQLVAFVQSKETVDEIALRNELQKLIPNYMVPTRFEFREQLPKNANGKLDRKKLKADYTGQLSNV